MGYTITNMPNIFYLLGLVIALTVHEFCHAFTADYLGDPTPRSQGRLTLNPLAHLDPLGTIMLILAGFGWGKPVSIDPYNFQKPKRDELLTALSGPVSNLVLAIIFSLIFRFLSFPILIPFIQINLILGIFNLLPLPPLDGSKVLLNLLPQNIYHRWQPELDRYGPILLLLLFITGFLGPLLYPILNLFLSILV